MHWTAEYVEGWTWSKESHCGHLVADVLKRFKHAPDLIDADPSDPRAVARSMSLMLKQHCIPIKHPEPLAICAMGTGRLTLHVGIIVQVGNFRRVLHCAKDMPTGLDEIEWLQSLFRRVEFYRVV